METAVNQNRVIIGCDIGQKADPTAIVVIEVQKATRGPGGWILPKGERVCDGRDIRFAPGKSEIVYVARDLKRLPLGTPYPEVARKIAGLVLALQERKIWKPRLLVDATGVGLPVVDLLREALRGRPCTLVPCTFTHGDKYTRNRTIKGETASVGKAHLVSRLQALLQTGRLKLPVLPESEALARELMDYEIRVDTNANDQYGAFKVGTHDDLVTALGLAVLDDPFAEAARRAAGSCDY